MWIVFFFLGAVWCTEATQIQVAVFPASVTPLYDQEVLLRLEQTASNQTTCIVTTKQNVNHTYSTSEMDKPQAPSSRKVSYWGRKAEYNDCGVRIRTISQSDYGTWQLTSRDANGTEVFGTASIVSPDSQGSVDDLIVRVAMSKEYVIDFETALKKAKITPQYCKVRRPNGQLFHEGFSGSCKATLPVVTTREMGTWTASVGILGSADEREYRYVLKEDDIRIQSGISSSNTTNENAINLYCNLADNDAKLTICRFIRLRDQTGFNMEQYFGNGQYSYFGRGLDVGDCGITLEYPHELDYGTWRCLLHIQDWNGSDATVGADVTLSKPNMKIIPAAQANPLYVLFNSSVTVSCYTEVPLKHCSMLLPTGQAMVGSSLGLGIGICSATLGNVVHNYTGTWTCIMTPEGGGEDLQDTTEVVVVESPFVAMERVVPVQMGRAVELNCRVVSTPPSISFCRFTRPDGVGFNVDNTTKTLDGRYSYTGRGLAYGDCGLAIEFVNMADHGNWTCSVSTQLDGQELADMIQVTVTGTTAMFPSSVTVDKDSDVVLRMKDVFESQVRCSVVMPNGTTVDLNYTDNEAVSYWGVGVAQGECGVKIRVSALPTTEDFALNEYQEWKLTSTNTQGGAVTAIGWIMVISDRRLSRSRAVTTLGVTLGQTAEVRCESDGSDYCILVPPGKDKRRYTPGDCKVSLEPVKNEHLGNWTCITGFRSSMKEMEDTINVVTQSSGLSVGIHQSSTKSNIRLYCNVVQALSFCRFVSPNETVFVLNDGMVSGTYSSWGQGLAAGYCGISINSPQSYDFGLWKCFVGIKSVEDKSVIQGGYIVLSSEELKPWVSADDEVYTISSSPLTLTCRAATSLLYCWFQHPNGTQLSSVPGDSLQTGHCSITLQNAQPTDSGIWSCHMGMRSTAGEELVVTTNVIVTESALASNASEIESEYSVDLTLMCKAIPTGSHLDYCRWVRPTGKALRPDSKTGQAVEGRYWYAGAGLDQGECGLRITGLQATDYGVWTCAALLQGQDREAQVSVTVVPVPATSLSMAMVGGLSGGIVAAVIVAVLIGFSIRGSMKKRTITPPREVIRMAELNRPRQLSSSSVSSASSGESTVYDVHENRL